jgi:hypothetical protein
MASAAEAEAEMAAAHHNIVEACGLRTALKELGHPQPPTHFTVNNSTAGGIANITERERQMKAMDM